MTSIQTYPPEFAILLKAPRPGLVKTRLAKDLGAEPAAALYRTMVEITLRAVLGTGWCSTIWYSPVDAASEFRDWLGDCHQYQAQPTGNLGERMAATASGVPNGRPLILLGGDCPGIATELLVEAGRALAGGTTVIGPSVDGGYYLLGSLTPLPDLFSGIAWSTPTVLADTRQRLRDLGRSWVELEHLRDVDTMADAVALRLIPEPPGR